MSSYSEFKCDLEEVIKYFILGSFWTFIGFMAIMGIVALILWGIYG